MPLSRMQALAANCTLWRAIPLPMNCGVLCRSEGGLSTFGRNDLIMNDQVKDTGMILRIGHLYPTLMSVAADRGNLFSIEKRCQWRGIATEVEQIYVKQTPDFTKYDLILFHGGADREMDLASRDIEAKAPSLREAVEANTVFLSVS